MKRLKTFLALFLTIFAVSLWSKDYVIYSVVQDIPMGDENELIKKNFYVNMGSDQGLEKGTVLNVFRTISRVDPYETKKRYIYKVKVGEVEVLHTENENSITQLVSFNDGEKDPLFEIEGFMIGDLVSVKVD